MNDDEIRELLRSVAQADARLSAPPKVEDRLMTTWDEVHADIGPRRRARARTARWIAVAAAAILAIGVLVGRHWLTRDTGHPLGGPYASAAAGFVPLAPADGTSAVQVVRVRLRASAAVSLGLVSPEALLGAPVDAELLIGDDSLARAIRMVPRGESQKETTP